MFSDVLALSANLNSSLNPYIGLLASEIDNKYIESVVSFPPSVIQKGLFSLEIFVQFIAFCSLSEKALFKKVEFNHVRKVLVSHVPLFVVLL